MAYETDWDYCTASVAGWDRYDAKNIDGGDEMTFRFDIYVGESDWRTRWRLEDAGVVVVEDEAQSATEETAFVAAMVAAAGFFLNNPKKYIAAYSHGKLGDLMWQAGFNDLFRHIATVEYVT